VNIDNFTLGVVVGKVPGGYSAERGMTRGVNFVSASFQSGFNSYY